MKKIRFIFFILFILGTMHSVQAALPYQEKSIVFGQSAAFSGPSRLLGMHLRDGISAAFNHANKNGGVWGNRLELIDIDDGYEPEKAILNARTLTSNDQVLALIGSMGTPTTKAALPVAQEQHVPIIGPFDGAQFLYKPFDQNIINIRASYNQEIEALVAHLTQNLGHTRIAVFYQNDSYGKSGLAGVQIALKARGLNLVAQGFYERNTRAVKGALLDIRKSAPESVIMIGTYKPCAEFVKLAHHIRLTPVFASVSFVGAKALAKLLGKKAEGILISQVVPLPWDRSLKVVRDYQAALSDYKATLEPGFVSLEGYMLGQFIIQALRSTSGEITRETLIQSIYQTARFDLGDVFLNYGVHDNQGMEHVSITSIKADGSFFVAE